MVSEMTARLKFSCSSIRFLLIGILIFNIPPLNSKEMLNTSEADMTEIAEDEAALKHLVSRLQNCRRVNQNLTDTLHELNMKYFELKLKLEDYQRQLQQQLIQNNEQNQILHEKLYKKMEQLVQENSKTTNCKDIVIQRRMDGSVDFYRTWRKYQMGFGNSSGEFFIGLDQLHKLTNSGYHELLIVLEDWDNERRYAKYDNFVIGSEAEKYALKSLGKYTGTAGDDFSYNVGQKFSTKDQDNDASGHLHCATLYKGAWWHRGCYLCNLNGPYKKGKVPAAELGQIVQWHAFRGNVTSLKFAEMTLRSK